MITSVFVRLHVLVTIPNLLFVICLLIELCIVLPPSWYFARASCNTIIFISLQVSWQLPSNQDIDLNACTKRNYRMSNGSFAKTLSMLLTFRRKPLSILIISSLLYPLVSVSIMQRVLFDPLMQWALRDIRKEQYREGSVCRWLSSVLILVNFSLYFRWAAKCIWTNIIIHKNSLPSLRPLAKYVQCDKCSIARSIWWTWWM